MYCKLKYLLNNEYEREFNATKFWEVIDYLQEWGLTFQQFKKLKLMKIAALKI